MIHSVIIPGIGRFRAGQEPAESSFRGVVTELVLIDDVLTLKFENGRTLRTLNCPLVVIEVDEPVVEQKIVPKAAPTKSGRRAKRKKKRDKSPGKA